MTTVTSTKDFVIMGPAIASGKRALNAVHALYYLPASYKLVLPQSGADDQASYDEIQSLIHRDELDGRVAFGQTGTLPTLTVADNDDTMPGQVFGDSPEALASAILNATRIPA
jgi:hypothetical protein